MFKLTNYYPRYTAYFQPHDIDRILPQLNDNQLDYYLLKLHGMREPISISIRQHEIIEAFLAPGAFDLTIDIEKPQQLEIRELCSQAEFNAMLDDLAEELEPPF